MNDYNNLPEQEKEIYREKAKNFWSNALLNPGMKINEDLIESTAKGIYGKVSRILSDDFVEGAAIAIHERENFPRKECVDMNNLNLACDGCKFLSDTGEFEQCEQCRRNSVLKDFFKKENLTSIEIIKKAFLIAENKIENFWPKQDACYLMYHTEHGDYQEFDTCHTYCEDCIEKVISEKTAQIKDGEHWKPDDFISLYYEIETLPERDSMLICEECGTLIDSGVLWTYDQDLDYYLYSCDEKDYQEFSKENFYKLSIILMPNFGAFLKFPEKTLQIADKVIKYLGGQNGA